MREIAGRPAPVNLAGRLVAQEGEARCDVAAGGVLASCALGEGRAVILADAALIDFAGPWNGAPEALEALLALAFAADGENAGDAAANLPQAPADHAKPPDSAGGNAAEASQ